MEPSPRRPFSAETLQHQGRWPAVFHLSFYHAASSCAQGDASLTLVHSMSPELLFWYGLALKMAMTAAIVVIVLVAVERSGPFVGALIAALPTATGAAYIILAIEHPASFIAASAVGSIAIGAAVSIFAATYAVLAQRHGLALSLGLTTVLWFAVAAACA
jgi:hypothetical protein